MPNRHVIKFTLAIVAAGVASAQVGAPAGGGQNQGSRATQIPLSGRPGQAGSVGVTQIPVPGQTSSINTLNTTIQVGGNYSGSISSGPSTPGILSISLDESIRRGLQFNLGTVGFEQSIRQARGQRYVALSQLMPNISADLRETAAQTNLAATGFSFKTPGFEIPSVVGPYHYFDLRASLTQTVADLTTLRNYRAANESLRATQLSAQDARDLVVLAVAGSYLQVITAAARLDSARAQVATAQASFDQAADRHRAGLAPRIEETRSKVELQTQQQRLSSQQVDVAKQKISFARLIGLPPGQELNLTDALPFAPLTAVTLDQAIERSLRDRLDLKAAEVQVHAAELIRKAASAERYPTASVNGDYGAIGPNPNNSHGTFTVTGSVHIPIFTGGRIRGDIQQADAALQARKAEYQDLRGRVEADVRNAFLDLNAAADQVALSRSNQELAQETLVQARDRFAAGVATTVEVVQAQESVASAEQDFISSLYAHNLGKASLARAMGQADQTIKAFLGGKH